jgi:hypothetical protein
MNQLLVWPRSLLVAAVPGRPRFYACAFRLAAVAVGDLVATADRVIDLRANAVLPSLAFAGRVYGPFARRESKCQNKEEGCA